MSFSEKVKLYKVFHRHHGAVLDGQAHDAVGNEATVDEHIMVKVKDPENGEVPKAVVGCRSRLL